MLKQILTRLAVGLAVIVGAVRAQAQPTATPLPFEFRTDPVLLVASYYNAIAVGDYARAYSYWAMPPDDAALEEFAAGLADTTRVAAYLAAPVHEDAGAGNVFAQVPVLLIAEHTDRTLHYFSGCITAHKTNVSVGDATVPDPNWRMRDALFSEVEAFDLGLLQQSCPLSFDDLGLPYTNRNSPVEVLAAYFNAIALRDYARAHGYWEVALSALEDFAAGFAETATATLVIRGDGAFVEGAAGSIYASVPGLVIATTTGGEVQYFAGCYVTRRNNVPVGDSTEPAPEWWLYNADVAQISDVSNGLALLDGACRSVPTAS